MEKKKLKLSISGTSKKTLNSIEQAKSKSKNTVVIEKKNSKFSGKLMGVKGQYLIFEDDKVINYRAHEGHIFSITINS